MTKVITPLIHDEFERVVASLSVKEKKEFVILTPAKVLVLGPLETLVKLKFMIETTIAQGMTHSKSCYTPKEFALGGQKKD